MADLSPLNLFLLVVAGVGSGFMNTLAAGGSLLTLPALMLLGLPADYANGTNRVSVLAQSISTVLGFHEAGKFEVKAASLLLAPTAVGAAGGSLLASSLPADLLKPILLAAMVGMSLLMILRPASFSPPAGVIPKTLRERPDAILWLFLLGFYAGFAQAGVGFLALLILGPILRYDLLRANALKIFLSGVFGIVPLGIFLLAGKVLWAPGAILAVATVVGSRLGVGYALKADERAIRWVLLACVLATVAAVIVKG
ncbi:MAG: sulfite exporter TauE/SafE family protein [Bdellovibrionota bacterium]